MFTKIQPEQIQLPTFFSNSGDFAIVQNTDTGINLNLSRNLTGDFDITGSFSVNSRGLLTTDETNLFSSESGNSALGGSDNVVSGSYCSAVASRLSTINGVNNVDLNGSSSIFHSGSKDNVLIGGANCIFDSGVTGAAIFSDKYSSTSDRGNHSAVINFNSGLFIENKTHFEDNFFVSSTASGVFSGDLNVLGVGYLTGSRIASEMFTTGEIVSSIFSVSGAINSGQTALSGVLDYKQRLLSGVINSGQTALSGVLDSKQTALSGFLTTGQTTLSGVLDSKQTALSGILNSKQETLSGILGSGQMIVKEMTTALYTGANVGTPTFSGSGTGQMLYLRTLPDGPKEGWIRFTGANTWT